MRHTIEDKKLKPLTHKWRANLVFQDILQMMAGVFIAGLALEGFLVPNNFFDGGITGISLLLHEIYGINLAIAICLLNLPLIILGYYWIGRSFAIKTLLCVILLGACVHWIPYPEITKDKLLVSVFGGMGLGLGIGLSMRAGCALDGIEVLAVFTRKKTSFTVTEIIMAINVLIFSVAAFEFGMETGLYSVLTYLAASRAIDWVVEGIESHTGVTIISSQSEEIKYRIVNDMGKAITVYKGERGFLPGQYDVSSDCDIILTVISRLEMRRLKNLVEDVDPKAFMFTNPIKEAAGGMLKRRNTH